MILNCDLKESMKFYRKFIDMIPRPALDFIGLMVVVALWAAMAIFIMVI